MSKHAKSVVTDVEFDEAVREYQKWAKPDRFSAGSLYGMLEAEAEIVQAEEVEQCRELLSNAHAHLAYVSPWLSGESDEGEIHQAQHLVWWAKFRLMVAERKRLRGK